LHPAASINGYNPDDDFGILLKDRIGAASASQISEARADMIKSVEYYACGLIPDADLPNFPASAKSKHDIHIKILNNWNVAGIFTLEASAKIIVDEIVRKYKVTGMSQFFDLLKSDAVRISGVSPSIGFDVLSIVNLGAVISALLNKVLSWLGIDADTSKFFKASDETITANVPANSDFLYTGTISTGTTTGSSTISSNIMKIAPYIAGVGLLLFLLLSDGKKKKKK
jgi:hypothetical protein